MELENGLRVKLNRHNKTASVTKSPKVNGKVFIPRFAEFDNQKYKIISIKKSAFSRVTIELLEFPEDSEVETFEEECFTDARIKKLQIPASVKFLKDDWCEKVQDLTEIEVSPKNNLFTYYDGKFLLGKSDENQPEFDILFYSRFDIEDAVIPPQIKILKKNSFSNHPKLNSITLSPYSKLQTIEGYVIYNSPIRCLTLPSSFKEIKKPNFFLVPQLTKVEIDKENQTFKVNEAGFVLSKSDDKSDNFDVLIFAPRDIKSVTIPSKIKSIFDKAFYQCNQIETITFEPNGSLEEIRDYAFGNASLPSKVVIPETVKILAADSFNSVKTMKSIEIQSKTVIIGSNCFANCTNLSDISFPNATEIEFGFASFNHISENAKIRIQRDARPSGMGAEKIKKLIVYNDEETANEKQKEEPSKEVQSFVVIEEEEEELSRIIMDDEKEEEPKEKEEPSKESQSNVIIEEEEEELSRIIADDEVEIDDNMGPAEKIIDEIFNQPVFRNANTKSCPPDQMFIAPETLKEAIQMKPYEYFIPTISLHPSKPPKDIDYDKIRNLLGNDAVIFSVELSPTIIRLALLSNADINEYATKLKAQFNQSVGKLAKDPQVLIPKDDDINDFLCRPSLSYLQPYSIKLDSNEIEKIRKGVQQSLEKDKDMYNWKCLFTHDESYSEMHDQIMKDIKANPYEMYIVNQTIYPSHYNENYNNIKNQEHAVECFLYHGSISKIHQKAMKQQDRGYFGEGFYLTRNPFYAATCSNGNKILEINEKAQIVCCKVVYNNSLKKEITDDSYNGKPIDNEIHHALVGDSTGFCPIDPLQKGDNKIIAEEFVLSNRYQIIPLCLFTVMRRDYYILWKDESINDNNEDYIFLNQISLKKEVNAYTKLNIRNALEIIRTKKYAKIKLITNGGDQTSGGKPLIEKARLKTHSNFLCLVYAGSLHHAQWISQFENVLFTIDPDGFKKFVELKMNLDDVSAFIENLYTDENKLLSKEKTSTYKICKFGINKDELLNFPERNDQGQEEEEQEEEPEQDQNNGACNIA